MKKKLLSLIASLGLCIPMFATDMCVEKKDGSVVRYNIYDVNKVYHEDVADTGKDDGYEYVDLGLPSGLKWATMNVGAEKPSDYGDFYIWGDAYPPASTQCYLPEYCKTCQKTSSALRESGVIDSKGNLTAKYDAATQNWRDSWRMPTKAEFDELLTYCTWTWTTLGGKNGYKVASKVFGNTNWIFLPAAGYRHSLYDTSIINAGSGGNYWSSTVSETRSGSCGTLLWFNSRNKSAGPGTFSYYGAPVRPVKEVDDIVKDYPVSGEVDGYGYVDLGLPSGLKWATMNIGAKEEIDYGTYYAWGEVAPAPGNNYSKANCKAYGKTSSALRESGVIDSKGNLTAKYDAATQNWSENWRMPTKKEFDELLNYCTWKWTSLGGVKGFKVVNKENELNWIFLPAAGYIGTSSSGTSSSNVGSDGYYFSSAVDEDNGGNARVLHFDSFSKYTASTYLYHGYPVRPVVKK